MKTSPSLKRLSLIPMAAALLLLPACGASPTHTVPAPVHQIIHTPAAIAPAPYDPAAETIADAKLAGAAIVENIPGVNIEKVSDTVAKAKSAFKKLPTVTVTVTP